MSDKKIYEVRVIEQMLVTYEVEVDDPSKINNEFFLHREENDGIREVSSEYYDFDTIYDIADEYGNEVSND